MNKKVLVLGASGMLGSAVLRTFAESPGIEVQGSVRSLSSAMGLPAPLHGRLMAGVDVEQCDSLSFALERARPDVVINCVGIVKQLTQAEDPLVAIPINSILPHRLARLCAIAGARLIHVSTDCVFNGSRGKYLESDAPDATDLYGRSKLLGEVDYPHAVTLRTSIIGHELSGARSLLNWFLSQDGDVTGFARAIFSGLPTFELARVMRDHVLPDPALCGLYHLSSAPIDKFSLLREFARAYQRNVRIVRDERLVIDRSLDSSRFAAATGYVAPAWPALVDGMAAFR